MLVGSARGGWVVGIYYNPVASCKAYKVNALTHLTSILAHARDKATSADALFSLLVYAELDGEARTHGRER